LDSAEGLTVSKQHKDFAVRLVNALLEVHCGLKSDPDNPCKVLAPYPGRDCASLDLTPFESQTKCADAAQYFDAVQDVDGLLDAYSRARQDKRFEQDLPGASDYVTDYAAEFLERILQRARAKLKSDDARRIAALTSNLDIYAAVKAVESLLNSQADLTLLKISERLGWSLHFDHLAIRCGSSAQGDAERVVDNLCDQHGYASCQLHGENYYKFQDGWNAYVLYKVLDNGQQLRLFIDQSSAGYSAQIIQHWNHVYGYTAHHLALSATCLVNGMRIAVPLAEQTAAMESHNIEVLTATGEYTGGLLEQVFTRPELNVDIPEVIREHLRRYDRSLEATIENGKLLELISRREIQSALKPDYFALYGIDFDNANPLHSAPVYPYFLPAQAAHVIRTSVEVA